MIFKEVKMNQIDDLLLFMKVVEIGSFFHTAKLLKISHPTVARRIKNLESRLGISLLRVSTKEFELTGIGQQLYAILKEQSGAIDVLLQEVQNFVKSKDEPQGTLKVALPTVMSIDLITPYIPAFLLKYPKINLIVRYQNQDIDLIKDGYDLAVLDHIPTQQSLKIKNIFNSSIRLYCTKTYAQKNGLPLSPDDLTNHLVTGFMLADDKIPDRVPIINSNTGVVTFIDMPRRIVMNNAFHSIKLLQSHEIICGCFDNTDPILTSNDIIAVLPDYHFMALKYYMVRHPYSNDLKTLVFCDFLEACLSSGVKDLK